MNFKELHIFAKGYVSTYYKKDKRLVSSTGNLEMKEEVDKVVNIKSEDINHYEKLLDKNLVGYKTWKMKNTFANSPIRFFTFDSFYERIDNLKKSKFNAAFDAVLCLINTTSKEDKSDAQIINRDDVTNYLFTALSLYESASIHLKSLEEKV